jgi:predicted Rossmann fold nucleotide-binding protein DprA/Smf involved in DNA uptake
LKAAGGNLSVDELSWKTETAAGLLAAHLLALEIKNKIVALPGKRFALKK